MRGNKYRVSPIAERTDVDGTVFASKAEFTYWKTLLNWQRSGEITDLKRQVPFELKVNGVVVTKYIADFVYLDRSENRHVVDVKGVETPEFKLKRKLMRETLGIEVELVRVPRR